MLKISRLSLTVALMIAAAPIVGAFSLLGPGEAWQTPAIGYNPLGTDIGDPHNLGEEYRFNIPTITFAFDESFLNYFGTAGTAAVHSAIAVLNALPAVSQMSSNLTEFPTDSKRVRAQASALNVLDIKSYTMGILLEQMGLASPERWAWALRDRRTFTAGGLTFTNYTVIQRNFDPITFSPTPFVNGVLYTYFIAENLNPNYADAEEDISLTDPTAIGFTSVANSSGGLVVDLLPGEFFVGLTRDDVGGLRYLLRTNNFQIEGLPNGTSTNAVTNLVFPPELPAGTGIILTNFATNIATRQGVDKVSFVPYPGDSPVGPRPAVTNVYTDNYLINVGGVAIRQSQIVTRVLTQPDIIFTAEDLGVDAGGAPVLFRRTDTATWQNNNAINGVAALAGPGVVQPPAGGSINLAFSKIGPYFFNQNPFFISEAAAGIGVVWGSFDGSTNEIIVFPNGATIQDLENRVLNP